MSLTQTTRSEPRDRAQLRITVNRRVRLIVRRAFGFHSAQAALAHVMLSCGPIELRLPWENAATSPTPMPEGPELTSPSPPPATQVSEPSS